MPPTTTTNTIIPLFTFLVFFSFGILVSLISLESSSNPHRVKMQLDGFVSRGRDAVAMTTTSQPKSTWFIPTNHTCHTVFPRDPRTGVEPTSIHDILHTCPTTTPNNFASFLDTAFSTSTCPRLRVHDFICQLSCPAHEPELEYTIRLLRLAEHSAKEHVLSLCVRKIIPVLLWISASTGKVRYVPCIKRENIPLRELHDAMKLIRATTCLVHLGHQHDFVVGIDPNDYATPTVSAPADTTLNYLYPLPAVIRFVGTRAHSVLLFPTGSHIVATAHCEYRHPNRWWRICTAHQTLRDSLPFAARSKSLMWRGLPTGVPWGPLTWRFHQRATLVREFGDANATWGFDVGYVRKLKRVANTSTELYAEMQREWHQKPQIPKEHHPHHAHLLHVDGNTASWGLSHKLNSGSALLWVESNHDYREHFYVHLKPWKHYIPIAVDMSDLIAARDFVLQYPNETEAIAKRAAHLVDTRMRAQDLYCYVMRLLLSIAKSQVRGEKVTEELLRKVLGDDRFNAFEEVDYV